MSRNCKSLYALIVLFSLLVACKKKKNDDHHANFYGKWTLVSYAVDANNNNFADADEIESLEQPYSNTVTYNNDGTGVAKSDTATTNITWQFIDENRLELKSNNNGNIDTVTIDNLSENDMTIRSVYSFGGLASYAIWYSYKKQ